ncbi:MAG: helix-hairpin-helix domain-containing protein [Candidatus Cloacimonetes bacterium]|nr:helix-hairpin-helix domain-containing protein [Candidatus Cloacimonadota bacterium]
MVVFILFALFLGLVVKYVATQNEPAYTGEIDSLGIYDEKVDIRTAGVTDLQYLPRIGEVMAQRIVEYREQKQFVRTEDLLLVKGIGEKTLERLMPYLVIFGDSVKVVAEPVTPDVSVLLDINSANLNELVGLPGIGKVKAQRIIDRRKAKGKFRTIEELLEVKGIGEKTLAEIKPLIKCER